MKKLFYVTLILFSFIFLQCRKCVQCKAVQDVDGLTFETPYEKFCGSSEDIDKYEKALKKNVPANFQIICDMQ